MADFTVYVSTEWLLEGPSEIFGFTESAIEKLIPGDS